MGVSLGWFDMRAQSPPEAVTNPRSLIAALGRGAGEAHPRLVICRASLQGSTQPEGDLLSSHCLRRAHWPCARRSAAPKCDGQQGKVVRSWRERRRCALQAELTALAPAGRAWSSAALPYIRAPRRAKRARSTRIRCLLRPLEVLF